MEWIPIDPENLPQEEVLAVNFNKGTYGYKEKCIGFISQQDTIECENNFEVLENCSHYIDINKLDIQP